MIVGTVGDVKQTSLALSDSDAFYTATSQGSWVDKVQSLVVRTRGDASSLTPAIKSAIWSVDQDQPIVRVATMDSLLARSEAQRHFVLVLFEAFGVAALILAATGIYGVLSGSVTERLRNRRAGGLRRDPSRHSCFGGSPGHDADRAGRRHRAAVASQTLISLLFGVSRLDPATYFGVITLLAAMSVVACGLPAWRAAQVDPATTLRAE